MNQTSYNFQLAKIGGLLAVIGQHYAVVIGHPWSQFLWIAAQTGLCIFAFSSGYFTAIKYGQNFAPGAFWQAKVLRLLGSVLVANCFVCCLLLVGGKGGLFHWHSLLSFFGLNGVLYWLDTPRATPLGNGLWFLTLLLAFYVAFPVIRRLQKHRLAGLLVTGVSLPGALWVAHAFPLTVTFWETAWFFVFGTFSGTHCPRLKLLPSATVCLLCGLAIPVVKFHYDIAIATMPLVIGLGIGVVSFLTSAPLGRYGIAVIMLLSPVMLEMYVIHTYLFLPNRTGSLVTDFGLTILTVGMMALILRPAGERLGRALHDMSPWHKPRINSKTV